VLEVEYGWGATHGSNTGRTWTKTGDVLVMELSYPVNLILPVYSW